MFSNDHQTHLADWSPSCFCNSASFLLKNSVRTSSLLWTSPLSFTTSSLTCKSPDVKLVPTSTSHLSQGCRFLLCCQGFRLHLLQFGSDQRHLEGGREKIMVHEYSINISSLHTSSCKASLASTAFLLSILRVATCLASATSSTSQPSVPSSSQPFSSPSTAFPFFFLCCSSSKVS